MVEKIEKSSVQNNYGTIHAVVIVIFVRTKFIFQVYFGFFFAIVDKYAHHRYINCVEGHDLKIDIDSYFLYSEIEEVTPMSTCVLPQTSHW